MRVADTSVTFTKLSVPSLHQDSAPIDGSGGFYLFGRRANDFCYFFSRYHVDSSTMHVHASAQCIHIFPGCLCLLWARFWASTRWVWLYTAVSGYSNAFWFLCRLSQVIFSPLHARVRVRRVRLGFEPFWLTHTRFCTKLYQISLTLCSCFEVFLCIPVSVGLCDSFATLCVYVHPSDASVGLSSLSSLLTCGSAPLAGRSDY